VDDVSRRVALEVADGIATVRLDRPGSGALMGSPERVAVVRGRCGA
jgi:hypothetical protein